MDTLQFHLHSKYALLPWNPNYLQQYYNILRWNSSRLLYRNSYHNHHHKSVFAHSDKRHNEIHYTLNHTLPVYRYNRHHLQDTLPFLPMVNRLCNHNHYKLNYTQPAHRYSHHILNITPFLPMVNKLYSSPDHNPKHLILQR